jgi:hypothetical protein
MSAVTPDAQAGPLLSSLSIMSLELRAAILAEQKRLPEAKALFTQAAQEEKAFHVFCQWLGAGNFFPASRVGLCF